ncbi:MAG TPA: hypothetical protein PLO93_06290, partial [Candidatus Omnitrophota bacterium]|nr:hypothetical protein [Candidatus Omnitrophota bacterium]
KSAEFQTDRRGYSLTRHPLIAEFLLRMFAVRHAEDELTVAVRKELRMLSSFMPSLKRELRKQGDLRFEWNHVRFSGLPFNRKNRSQNKDAADQQDNHPFLMYSFPGSLVGNPLFLIFVDRKDSSRFIVLGRDEEKFYVLNDKGIKKYLKIKASDGHGRHEATADLRQAKEFRDFIGLSSRNRILKDQSRASEKRNHFYVGFLEKDLRVCFTSKIPLNVEVVKERGRVRRLLISDRQGREITQVAALGDRQFFVKHLVDKNSKPIIFTVYGKAVLMNAVLTRIKDIINPCQEMAIMRQQVFPSSKPGSQFCPMRIVEKNGKTKVIFEKKEKGKGAQNKNISSSLDLSLDSFIIHISLSQRSDCPVKSLKAILPRPWLVGGSSFNRAVSSSLSRASSNNVKNSKQERTLPKDSMSPHNIVDLLGMPKYIGAQGKGSYVVLDYMNAIVKLVGSLEDAQKLIGEKLLERLSQSEQGLISAQGLQYLEKVALDIYVPLAIRLGLEPLAQELRDRVFRAIDPDQYQETARQMQEATGMDAGQRKAFLDTISDRVVSKLRSTAGIVIVNEEHRVKGIYASSQKIGRKGKKGKQYTCINDLEDLLGIHLIVDSEESFWNTVGQLRGWAYNFKDIKGEILEDQTELKSIYKGDNYNAHHFG